MHLLAAQAGAIEQDGEAPRAAPKSGYRFSDKATRRKPIAGARV
jgi:hypothetical protein